jgi:hypothetical protein
MTCLNLWDTAKAVLRGKFIAIYQKDRKFSNQRPNTTAETPRKTRTNPKTNRRKEIIKITVEINEIETNKQKPYKESMKQKAHSLKK